MGKGFGFKIHKGPSLKRMTGITSTKRKIAKATGIPTTRSGRRAKFSAQRQLKKTSGCCVSVLFLIGFFASVMVLILTFVH